jgi:hypothetical protein
MRRCVMQSFLLWLLAVAVLAFVVLHFHIVTRVKTWVNGQVDSVLVLQAGLEARVRALEAGVVKDVKAVPAEVVSKL